MNIPEKVKIGGYEYDIEVMEAVSHWGGKQGCQDGNSLEIKIASNMPEPMQHSVLIHEMIEAINYHYDLKLKHEKIMLLEAALYQIIVDNPEMFS